MAPSDRAVELPGEHDLLVSNKEGCQDWPNCCWMHKADFHTPCSAQCLGNHLCQDVEFMTSRDSNERACIEAQALNRSPAHTYSMHGGAGALISIGLLRRVSWEAISRCVNNQWSSGKVVSASECIWANTISYEASLISMPHEAILNNVIETMIMRKCVRFDDMQVEMLSSQYVCGS